MRSKGRLTWRGKLLFVLLGPVVGLGLLEIALWVAGFTYEGDVSPLQGRIRGEREDAGLYVSDPDLLWTLHPSTVLDKPRRGFLAVRSNSHGLRGAEIPGPKRPGEIRVLCLGDSVTFGLALAEEDTWPNHMKSALQRAPGFKDRLVTVVNGALPGWGSVQGIRLLDRLSSLEPDLIVFWFGMNDASPARRVPDSELRPGPAPSRMLQTIRGLHVYQLIDWVVDGLRGGREAGTWVSPEEFHGAVQHLLELEKAGGPKTVFVRTPERLDVTAGQLERLSARADEEGVDRIAGPRRLLSWTSPAPEGSDLTGHRAVWSDQEVLLFEANAAVASYSRVDTVIERSVLERDVENLPNLKRALDVNLRGLPANSLEYVDLFGDSLQDFVFLDNCHLSPYGSMLAGKSLAGRALRLLRR